MKKKCYAIDLFSGCGGVSCGLSLSGFTVKAAVEIDDKAAKTYLNYKPLSHVNVLYGKNKGDICKLTGQQILHAAKLNPDDIYLLAGCPPCQNFSRQNPNNKNKSIDERKKLLFEFLRIILDIKPPFVLMENVPGIKSTINKPILDDFLNHLNILYDVREGILNAADYGVPQLRKRYVLHAVRKDISLILQKNHLACELPLPTHDANKKNGLLPWVTVREAIGDLPSISAGETYTGPINIYNHRSASLSDINIQRIREIRANGGSRKGLSSNLVLNCHKAKDSEIPYNGHTDVYGIMDPEKPSPTMTCGCLCYSKGRYGHYEQDRAISVREAARLQTFPDDFVFADSLTESAKQIGNAVPIKLVKASGKIFKEAIVLLQNIASENAPKVY